MCRDSRGTPRASAGRAAGARFMVPAVVVPTSGSAPDVYLRSSICKSGCGQHRTKGRTYVVPRFLFVSAQEQCAGFFFAGLVGHRRVTAWVILNEGSGNCSKKAMALKFPDRQGNLSVIAIFQQSPRPNFRVANQPSTEPALSSDFSAVIPFDPAIVKRRYRGSC